MTPEEAFRLGELHGETQRRLGIAIEALQEIVTGTSILMRHEQYDTQAMRNLFDIALVGLAKARGFKLQAVGTPDE